MLTKLKARKLALFAVAAAAVAACAVIASIRVWSQQERKPTTKDPAGQSPSRVISSINRKAPSLTGGRDVRSAVLEFIKFAGNAGSDQREEIRRYLQAARDNKAVVDVLCSESFRAEKEDHSQALLVLSLLGEMRSPAAVTCLNRFLNLPFPTTGTNLDGEIIEQTALATLQAKAVDGLAYINSKESNQMVLNAVKNHPSIIVRAEAIEAYQWNHRDRLPVARRVLTQYVRKGEEIYIDRVRRETNEPASSFNRKVEAFLKKHPRLVPPKPENPKERRKPKDEKAAQDINPPRF